ncbi:hypothetical protein HPB49_020034 [Dermacentor silvarum]|uniref:Uncharacterized protein n=1 Tax=Dermacentor silvarum TaxID=543639 RepID=A0ACB8CB12_DERSI|nr:hypothetical protein HPB49_020034 [Dermacentor silvarum]
MTQMEYEPPREISLDAWRRSSKRALRLRWWVTGMEPKKRRPMRRHKSSTVLRSTCGDGVYRAVTSHLQKKVSLFRAPSDPVRVRKWARSIKRRFVQRTFKHVINGQTVELDRERPTLSQDAIPTIFPDAPSYFTTQQPKREQKETWTTAIPRQRSVELRITTQLKPSKHSPALFFTKAKNMERNTQKEKQKLLKSSDVRKAPVTWECPLAAAERAGARKRNPPASAGAICRSIAEYFTSARAFTTLEEPF